MKSTNKLNASNYAAENIQAVQLVTERIQRILDAKYKPANLVEITEQAGHLNISEKQKLLKLLRKFEPMFNGQLGQWTGPAYDIELKEGVTPYHARPFTVPKCYELAL